MQFEQVNLKLNNPEFWLISLLYVGFWVYSYYALVVLLIHTRKQIKSVNNDQ